MIRVSDVRVNDVARTYVQHVLDSGELSRGEYVTRLERRVAEVSGTRYAVAVSSGTAALCLLIAAFAPKKVTVPAFTFAGTAHAALLNGCEIHFADIRDDWLIDPDQIEGTPIPVHLFGARAATPVGAIEDGAQAIGQTMNNGIVSFYGSKTGGAGEGGAVVTNDGDIAATVRAWRDQGSTERYRHVVPGGNYRMSNLSAAVALGQLSTLESVLEVRRRNASMLWTMLHEYADLPAFDSSSSWHQFTVEVPRRETFRQHLAERGIETTVHYPYALPDLSYLPDADTPRARQAAERVVSLPVHEYLSVNEVEMIGEAAREACSLV